MGYIGDITKQIRPATVEKEKSVGVYEVYLIKTPSCHATEGKSSTSETEINKKSGRESKSL